MGNLRDYIKNNPHTVISIPAILCAIQFVMGLLGVVRTGVFDGATMNQLLSTADGFESVVLFITMLVLKGKKK